MVMTTDEVPSTEASHPEHSVYEEFSESFAKIAEQLKAWDKEFGFDDDTNSTNSGNNVLI